MRLRLSFLLALLSLSLCPVACAQTHKLCPQDQACNWTNTQNFSAPVNMSGVINQTGPVSTANPCSIDGLIYVSNAGCYKNLEQAINAASDKGLVAGTVIVPAGTWPLGATTALGTEPAPVSVYLMTGAKVICTIRNGTDCVKVQSSGYLRGANWGRGAVRGTSGIYCGTGANLTSLVTNKSHSGAGDGPGGIEDIFLSCEAKNVTLGKGVLWWQLTSNNWASNNITIVSSAHGPAYYWSSGYSGFLGPNYISNLEINCLSPGCIPIELSGPLGPLFISGGDINYHPGSPTASGGVVVMNDGGGITGPASVTFAGTHFEFETTGDVFSLDGVNDIKFDNVFLNGVNNTAANCLHILNSQVTPSSVDFSGHIVAGTCTNVVNNVATGTVIPPSAVYQGDIRYISGGNSSGTTMYIDGPMTEYGQANLNGGVLPGNYTIDSGRNQLPAASSHVELIVHVTDSTTISSEGQRCVGSSSSHALAFATPSGWKCF